MKQSINDIVKRVVLVPHDFNHENKSEFALWEESGYLECFNEINEREIVEVLQLYPHLVEEWFCPCKFSSNSHVC